MSRLADRLGLPREYDRVSDDGCAGCGAPRMRRSVWCVDCATGDGLTPEELASLFPPLRSTGCWHLASRRETDGLVVEVYEGPTFYPGEAP